MDAHTLITNKVEQEYIYIFCNARERNLDNARVNGLRTDITLSPCTPPLHSLSRVKWMQMKSAENETENKKKHFVRMLNWIKAVTSAQYKCEKENNGKNKIAQHGKKESRDFCHMIKCFGWSRSWMQWCCAGAKITILPSIEFRDQFDYICVHSSARGKDVLPQCRISIYDSMS